MKDIIFDMSLRDDGWFALEKGNADTKTFKDIVAPIVRAFVDINKEGGAKEFVKFTEENEHVVASFHPQKVPNVVKIIVNDPKNDIKIKLTGRDTNGESKEKIMGKPFNANECTEIIPYYHPNKKASR